MRSTTRRAMPIASRPTRGSRRSATTVRSARGTPWMSPGAVRNRRCRTRSRRRRVLISTTPSTRFRWPTWGASREMTMIGKPLLRLLVALALSALLGACTQKNTADQDQGNQGSAAGVAVGVDRFLLFPNPIGQDPFAQDGGTFETNTNEYAAAYYRAIDPGNAKDTIDKWKTANLFGPTGNGTEHLAVFRDVKDLGYGRRMTGRMNT